MLTGAATSGMARGAGGVDGFRFSVFIHSMKDQRNDNNFGVVRLILAFLVIVAHTPELIDGDRSRELATLIWHTLSFGEIAVDGFFFVSGYLITQSFQRDQHVGRFLWKRVLRIYPAFVAAFAFCAFVVAPLAGGTATSPLDSLISAATLQPPGALGAFAGMPYPVLNGAMWSIAYEFRCYLMVLLLGALGALRWRAAIAVTGIVFLLLTGFQAVPRVSMPFDILGLLGYLPLDVRMAGAFLIGMSFYLYRDRYSLTGRAAAVAIVALAALLFVPQLAELALAILGGYAILWFVFAAPALPVARQTDISYGLYLYAWPLGSLIVWYLGMDTSPWLVAALTTIVAIAFGFCSWFLIERPALRLKQSKRRTSQPV